MNANNANARNIINELSWLAWVLLLHRTLEVLTAFYC